MSCCDRPEPVEFVVELDTRELQELDPETWLKSIEDFPNSQTIKIITPKQDKSEE